MIKKHLSKSRFLCNLILSIGMMISLIISSGCASIMAAKQAEYTDMSVLHVGASRNEIVAAFGPPILSEKDEKGNLVETYQFKQGYKTGTKVVRVMFHIAADVFTAFLWEFIGMPIEIAFDGNRTTVSAKYNDKNEIEESNIITK